MKYIGEPSNGMRDVRVIRPEGGSFTKGTARSSYLGRNDGGELFSRSIGNPANPKPIRFKPKPKTAETRRNERVERKTAAAKPCPGCGMKVYVARTCFCW